eukprot:TRINITY_DN75895_c0_g1_i1.p1 TRINITY_DN75895_c0_g1~~TRINITY_DN75895_c0_g1_i1.p1  ORF type:complete len:430 (+),score=40.71 TRINITY_DN75895_c0_g1_i1:21-1310(+)
MEEGDLNEPLTGQNKRKKIHWKRIIFLCTFIPLGIAVFAVCFVFWSQKKEGHKYERKLQLHMAAIITGGYMGAVASWMSGFLIYLHLTSYTNPDIQQKIIRILIMIPVFCVDSFAGLVLNNFQATQKYAVIPNLLRNCYESYIIYTFFSYMIVLLGGEQAAVAVLQEKGSMKHPFPLCCLKPLQLGEKFLTICRRLVVQFMLINPITTLVASILSLIKVTAKDDEGNLVSEPLFKEGDINFSHSYVYLAAIDNVSVTLAFSALFYFYVAMKKALEPYKPLGKFAVVKGVIFVSFWQGLAVALFVKLGVLKCYKTTCQTYTPEIIATALQEWLILFEMVFVACGCRWAFGHEEFMEQSRSPLMAKNVVSAFRVDDVMADVHRDVKGVSKGVARGVQETRAVVYNKGAEAVKKVAELPKKVVGKEDSPNHE